MKIGILGSGVVGQALANGFIKHGNDVMVGTRDLNKLSDWAQKAGKRGHVGSFTEAAAFGEMVVLAVKGSAAQDVLNAAGAMNLNGKVVLDTTNPISDAPPHNGVISLFTTSEKSLMEDLQSVFPQVKFVKTFNCIGSAHMVNPNFGRIKPSMFICGNDTQAKEEIGKIVEKFGFEVEDVGGVTSARALEPLCMLWCLPGFLHNDWNHAFKFLRK